jgi:hypothetical protein
VIAALYVDTENGPYAAMAGVDAWGVDRDARKYAGPHPVVAHPPCGGWGRFWWRYGGGEIGRGCAVRAVDQVRRWGGVLEHPSRSGLWSHPLDAVQEGRPPGVNLPGPGEWPDRWGGYTLTVRQCDWGHRCEKPTWLYVVGVDPAAIPPFPPPGSPTHVIVTDHASGLPSLPKRERHITPPRFAEWLVSLASLV